MGSGGIHRRVPTPTAPPFSSGTLLAQMERESDRETSYYVVGSVG